MNKISFVVSLLLPLAAAASGLESAIDQSVAGMKVQSARINVVSQNIANSDSTGSTPGSEPYRRKIIFFKNGTDPKTGEELISVDKVTKDMKSDFEARFDPSHPAANDKGYVLLPNVSKAMEMVDMKEAQNSYEANLGAIQTSKRMYLNTLDLLK